MASASTRVQGSSFLTHSTSYSAYSKIDFLTSDEIDQNNFDGVFKEITKRHWKPADSRTACFTRSCRKQFTLLDSHHHCRRCGEVFCSTCVQFAQRLNRLAQPDPDGDWYKVCKDCFQQGQLTDGLMRDLMPEFSHYRAEFKRKMAATERMLESPFWRSKLDLDRECHRLLQGFEKSIGQSEIWRTLHGVKSLVSTPDWMKSSVFIREDLATSCQVCSEAFSLMRQKHFCRVCGIAVCKSCSNEDLLIYIPDGERESGGNPKPRLAIIKIIGCPGVEPEISWHLRVCPSCRKKLEDRQVLAQEEGLSPAVLSGHLLDQLIKIDEKFQETEGKVRTQLPKYQEITDSLEDSSNRNKHSNNVRTLAKAQGDLADILAQHVTIVQQLKLLRPATDTQDHLLKAYIRAKCNFYLDNMSTFRALKHKLSESAPPESLHLIQRAVDKNAIISTHIYLRQLVYEAILMSDKFSSEDFWPPFLKDIEQVVERDVQICLQQENEDIEVHMSLVKDMIRKNLKNSKLIRFSPHRLERSGQGYIRDVMRLRIENVLNKVNNQLRLNSAHRSFQASKAALEEALSKLKQQQNEDREERTDFVFVDRPGKR